MSKRRYIPLGLALCASTALFAPTVFPHITKSDRERDGLIGPVRTMVWKAGLVSNKSGHFSESDLYDVEIVGYDIKGRRLDRHLYGMCDACGFVIPMYDLTGRSRIEIYPWPFLLLVHSYGSIGNRSTTNYYDGGGNVYRKWIYRYEYDSAGNWTKQTLYMQDAKFFNGDDSLIPREVYYRTITYY